MLFDSDPDSGLEDREGIDQMRGIGRLYRSAPHIDLHAAPGMLRTHVGRVA
jgi:hypothetical protein